MIADTTFFIDLLIGREDARNFAKNNFLVTTSITIFELYQGLKASEEVKLKSLLEEVNVFSLDESAAVLAGKLAKRLKEKGLETDPEDCMIAAIALRKNLLVITKNVKHFSRFEGLKTITY